MTAVELIEQERRRQILAKGWTAEHDDTQRHAELARCADLILQGLYSGISAGVDPWPGERAKHVNQKYAKDAVKQLTIAGALIAAEIDRLLRLNPPENAS